MNEIKLIISLITFGLVALVNPVMAATVNLSITQLPSYVTNDTFKLSYSCLGCSSVQFYVSKNGGSWNSFGNAMTDASGQVQVTSSQINEQASYAFKVVDTSGTEAKTETIYDVTGPSPVTGFYKEEPTASTYKIHWKNSDSQDFARVILYRGETSGFSADGSHEIAQVLGSPNSDMTYDESVPLADKEYYYAIRAIDKAGNSSGLVGDAGTVLGTSTQATSKPIASSVVYLPKETQGEVLPESTEASEEFEDQESEGLVGEVVEFVKNKTKLTVLIIAAIGFAGYLLYRKSRKS